MNISTYKERTPTRIHNYMAIPQNKPSLYLEYIRNTYVTISQMTCQRCLEVQQLIQGMHTIMKEMIVINSLRI
jgi:hypothetical protein